METANTNPEAKVSENPEEIEEDKKNKTILIRKILFITIGILLLFLIILALVFILKSEEPKESTESAPAIEQTAKENENNTSLDINNELINIVPNFQLIDEVKK